MRKVIMWNVMTLDGFFEGSKPWDLDFHNSVWGDELEQFSLEQLRATGILVFGRKTYEGMAAYWRTEKGAVADFMNSIPKIVFSRTLTKADWTNASVVNGEAATEIASLKRQPGKDIYIFGSAVLCAALTRHRLIDEYRIGLAPVVLGQGSPLFKAESGKANLKLIEARTLATGCVLLRYAPLTTD